MNNSLDKHDKKFQKIFQNTLEEQPSLGFTETLMGRIEKTHLIQVSNTKQKWATPLIWIAVASSFLVITSGVLYYFHVKILTAPNFEIVLSVVKSLRNSFEIMFSSFEISPLTVAILIGIVSLMLIDRLLRLRPFKKNISSLLY